MKSLSGLVWFPDSAMAWSSHTGRPVWLGTRALEAHPPLPAYTAPPGTPRDGAHGGWQSSPFAQGLCAAEPFLQGQFQHLGSRLALVAPCPRTLWSQSLLAHFRILTPPGASQATGGEREAQSSSSHPGPSPNERGRKNRNWASGLCGWSVAVSITWQGAVTRSCS